jgi:hypothetical protein
LALGLFYPWYRGTEKMQRRLLGERTPVPTLDAWLEQSMDPVLDEIADGLAAGFPGPRSAPLVALALDFWTWRRLDREGLDDDAAAALMSEMVAGAAAPR